MTAVGAVEYVPFGAETWRNPWDLYERLRDEEPLHWSDRARCYVLSRFDDVFRAARDTETFSSAQGLTFTNEVEELGLAPTIVMMDPPDHTRFRRLVSRGFTPRQVSEIEPGVREFVVERIEELLSRGTGDFIEALARPLPCFVVAHYLGVSEADRAQFEGWTQAIVQAGSSGHDAGAADALASLYGYFSELIERRRAEPTDDMVSTLVAADDGKLGVDEILGYAFVMIAGGNDTATGLLGVAAELLTDNPEQRAHLRNDPTLVPNAVEECLRLSSPVQGLCRVTTTPATIHGAELPTGTRVLLCYGAANRDPREFGPDADQMNVGREIPRLLTFSSGPHFCLGAAAARLQGRVVLEELLTRCPEFRVDSAAGAFAGGAFTRRYESLPFATA
jgi:cytochrome P450 family 130